MGRGMNKLELGLPVRYETTREFALYIGVSWAERRLRRRRALLILIVEVGPVVGELRSFGERYRASAPAWRRGNRLSHNRLCEGQSSTYTLVAPSPFATPILLCPLGWVRALLGCLCSYHLSAC